MLIGGGGSTEVVFFFQAPSKYITGAASTRGKGPNVMGMRI